MYHGTRCGGGSELGTQVYATTATIERPAERRLAVYQLPGTNALAAANGVKKRLTELQQRFPRGIDYVISLDTTLPVTAGIEEMAKTLLEALGLVVIVVYLFLQSWRATLIPLLAVPCILDRHFSFFPLLGFSINTLSLFGLVLAIGLVVDDAIVVVEAVERHIQEGLSPKEATFKAMKEITAPVVGVALVLASVFVPTAFIPGITGRLYQQFAVTIAISVLISAFNALTLSPALCALLLRHRAERNGPLANFFQWFNQLFSQVTKGYVSVSAMLIRRSGLALALLVAFGAAAILFRAADANQLSAGRRSRIFYVNLQLPNAASLQRTDEVCRKIENLIAQTPGVKYTTAVAGFSLLSSVQTTYSGFFFVTLEPWKERKKLTEQYQALKGRLNLNLIQIPEGTAFGFSPPAIPGAGVAGGVTFVLENRLDKGAEFLARNVEIFLSAARKQPELGRVITTLLPSVPQVYFEVDREKAVGQGVALTDVYNTLQSFLVGSFVNYFNRFGRQWQVYVQADGESRSNADQVDQFYVRNQSNNAVLLSSLVHVRRSFGPEFTMRYNLYRSAQIQAIPAAGYSSAQAMTALERVFAQTMPAEMGYDYSGMSFQEKKAQRGASAPHFRFFVVIRIFNSRCSL